MLKIKYGSSKKASVTSVRFISVYIKKSILLLGGCFFVLHHVSAQSNDAKILIDIQDDRSKTMTTVYKDLSKTTSLISVGMPVGLFATGLATHNADMKKKAIYLGETFIVNTAITTILKSTIKRQRPFVKDPSIIPLDAAGSYSFPSGHTSDAFATATSLSIAYPKWYIIAPSFLWASGVGYSRMYLGVHYPSDVVAGAIVGAGSAFLTKKINDWIQQKHHAHVTQKLLN
jgi:membrane-associated phospholipid phosphatase